MPPKKTIPKTGTVRRGRPAKPENDKAKPKLKIPSIIKIKIPKKDPDGPVDLPVSDNISQNTAILTKKPKDLTTKDKLDLANTNPDRPVDLPVSDNISQNTAILTKKPKDLTTKDKLDLTNTIARAQLDKLDPVIFPPDPEPKNIKVVKKRGPRKKIVFEKTKNGSATEVPVTTKLEDINAQPTTVPDINAQPTTVPEINAQPTTVPDINAQPTTVPEINAQPTTVPEINAQPTTVPEINAQPTTSATVPKPKRKYVRKPPFKSDPANTVKKTAQPVKRKLISPANENSQDAKKPKRKWSQSRISDMKIVVRRNSIQSQNESSPKNDKSRTVTIAKPKVVRRKTPRGKKTESTEDLVLGSPSILTQNNVAEPQAVQVIKQEAVETAKTASPIESRKTSLNSELSWTKDISDSSNTTSVNAVTSSDVVIIDNKLPILSLSKLVLEDHSRAPSVEKEFSPRTPSDSDLSSSSSSSSSSSDSDSDSDSTTKCHSFKESEIVDVHSLNLSTSSESHRSPILTQKNIRINTMNSSVNNIDRALDKLAMSLKKIDMEIINWVGYQNEDININNKKIKDKIFQNLQEESNIILQCQHVNKLLSGNDEIPSRETTMAANTEVENESNFVKPCNAALLKTSDNNFDKTSLSKDHSDEYENKFDVNDNFALDNIPYVPFDQSLDDEDALSLYAESIGFESHRNSISSPPHNPTEFEEYIPQPIKNPLPTNPIVYNPTKINSKNIPETVQNVKTAAMICEKQNADSTSVFRKANQDMNHMEGIEKLPGFSNPSTVRVQMNKEPCLISSMFKAVPGSKSYLFNGMCFFNLIDSCKHNSRCRFPHIQPSPTEISARLVRLSEKSFIQEYMLMKNWPKLRRKFGLCFINECKRRDLTRFLIEMAMDFIMKSNQRYTEDAILKTHVVEEVLLILNKVDLHTHEDLLKYNVSNKQLCTVFMEAIANTQNFSRFKPVFIKLTEFIIGNNQTFSLNVAKHILERVVILPFEETLARALISIIEHTDSMIYDDLMMGQFEKQLATNQNLLEWFLEVKEKAGVNRMVVSPEFNPAVPPPVIRQEVEMKSPLYPDRMQRYTSPDTTHLDPMNKPPDEPIITRTIHFNQSLPTINYSSSSNESMDEFPRTPNPNPLFKSWRDKSILNKLTPQQRFPNVRRVDRQVSYARSPSKFPRHLRPY